MADNMLKNGDFEEGPYIFPNTPWGVLVPPMDEDDYSPLSPWMVLSSTKSVKYVDAPHHVVPRGARAVELVAGVEAALRSHTAVCRDFNATTRLNPKLSLAGSMRDIARRSFNRRASSATTCHDELRASKTMERAVSCQPRFFA